MIKSVIFDIGGVVVMEPHDSWKNIFSEIGPSVGIPADRLVLEFQNNIDAIQNGSITLLDFYRNLVKVTRKNIKPENLLKKHLEIYMKLSGRYDQDVLGLIKKLRQKFLVACFTNIEPELVKLHRERGLFDCFDRAFISTEMGMRKPDPEACRHVIKELGIRLAEGIFIDNNKEYVDVAEKMGLKGITYTGVHALLKKLPDYSVNV